MADKSQHATNDQRLFLYSTTVSDVGTVRSNNQDSSFAGEHIAAICDGMGGHAGGDIASTIAIRSLAHIEKIDEHTPVDTVAKMLSTSFSAAHDAIVGKAHSEHTLSGMGTTVTAVSLVGDFWVLAHIGDSRAYLLRDKKLSQMTADHNYVQHLIDTDRITEAEAKNHPQRNIVMRVLGDFDMDSSPDIAIFAAQPADRWLLCSDGLCGVLEDSTIESMLNSCVNSLVCAQKLVEMALKAGSTDNVTAVIADASLALHTEEFDIPHQIPTVGGAAISSLTIIADIINQRVASAPGLHETADSPALRAAALVKSVQDANEASIALPTQEVAEVGLVENVDTGEIPVVEPGQDSSVPASWADSVECADGVIAEHCDSESVPTNNTLSNALPDILENEVLIDQGNNDSDHMGANADSAMQDMQGKSNPTRSKKTIKKRIIISILSLFVVAALAISGALFAVWSQSKYFLGINNSQVTIYQGLHTSVFGLNLYHSVESTDVQLDTLPQNWVRQLEKGIQVDSLPEARLHVQLLKRSIKTLKDSNNSQSSSAKLPSTDAQSKDVTSGDLLENNAKKDKKDNNNSEKSRKQSTASTGNTVEIFPLDSFVAFEAHVDTVYADLAYGNIAHNGGWQ